MNDPTCFICGGTRTESIAFPKPKSDLFKGLSICVCKSCGMGWTSKRVDSSQLDNYYAHDYAQHAARDQRVGPEEYFSDSAKMFKPHRSQSQLRLADTALARSPKRILDLGAGFGTALHLARKEFWPDAELLAVEPDLSMKPYLEHLGSRIVVSLDEVTESSCDLIIASHVLEHYQAHDIDALLSSLNARLTPDGIIVAEVPNSNFRAYPRIAGHSHEPHLLFFSQKAFGSLFESSGFAVPFISTVGKLRQRGYVADFIEKLRRRLAGRPEYGPHRAAIRLVARRA